MNDSPPAKPFFHPAAVVILIIGVASLLVGALRVHFIGPSARVQSVMASEGREPGPMRIVVTLPPLMWAVKALAPKDAEITLLAPAGAGCEGIELTPAHVAAIGRADVVVRSGGGVDQPVLDATGQSRSVIRARDVTLTASGDGHAWLDPARMEHLIAAIGEAIDDWESAEEKRLLSMGECADPLLFVLLKLVRNKTAEELTTICREIDKEYRERLSALRGRSVITHHDAWRAMAQRYGLDFAAVIQHSHDAEPSPSDLAEVARIAREKSIRAIFVEPQLNPAGAVRIAEVTGAKLLTLDPVGGEDWPAMMRKNLDALVEGLMQRDQ